ncbi:MAG: SAM-dependent methyltransferase [Deltaproteobacteria bacterium]|nr:SAM-dependent methyltransferase [Deltaproteobacteria bacterium]
MTHSKTGIEAEILKRISEKGRITFAEFMDAALYWPERGYYTAGRSRWGAGGDYITNTDISPVFSRLMAKCVHEMWTLLGSPAVFTLIEAGSGRGLLTEGILDAAESLYPGMSRAVRVRLVEKNRFLRKPAAARISWHENIEGLQPVEAGCILSNELIDSFPVHRVVCSGGFKELYVGHDGTRFIEEPGAPSCPELKAHFDSLGITLTEGVITEVNLKAKEWIRKAGSLINKGFVATIDYGLPARELYSREIGSTIACHFRHTINHNPYINIGMQDITAHVDFTTLAAKGEKAGLKLTGFTTQKNFLLGLGILEELKPSENAGLENRQKISHNRELVQLITPGGAGDAFKVLVQHKGIQKPELKGLSFKDLSSRL